MDLDEKKKRQIFEAQHAFLADRSYIPGEPCNNRYVTAMLPPQEFADEYYCQINNSERSYQMPDCNYEDVDDIECDPGVDVDGLLDQSIGFVCEEVMLLKSADGKFGLTLFYCQNYTDPYISDIFIGEIEPESPASYSSGLCLGDQVLQINHLDVFTRDRVMHLFSQSTNNIHLLVARSTSEHLKLMPRSTVPRSPSDPYVMANMQNALDSYATLDTQPSIDALDADSGMGRLTDENMKAEDSSDCSSFHSRHGTSSMDASLPPLPDDFIDLDVTKINEELNKLRLQCMYLEQVKAQKETIQKTSASQEAINKSVPRMGTRVPPRLSQPVTPLTQKINSTQPPALTLVVPVDKDNRSYPAVLRFSNEPSHKTTVPLTNENDSYITQNHKDINSRSVYANPSQVQEESNQMQWVMKKRSDGSKYVVKRPMRNQILRDRAKQLAADRQTQSTDDDAASEIRTGRCWNRTERKRQFEKYRDYRKQKETTKNQPHNTDDYNGMKTKRDTDQDESEVRVMLTFL